MGHDDNFCAQVPLHYILGDKEISLVRGAILYFYLTNSILFGVQ